MKLLLIFTDMLGAEYTNLGNPERPVSSIDGFLTEMGGTFFNNCFTPAPDTPRSSACMWTGLYPHSNGCDNRLKYPGKYLETESTIWNTLDKEGYTINAHVKASMNRIGLLPSPYDKYVCYDTYRENIDHFQITDNSFTFIYLPDLHLMMDVNGYNQKMFSRGINVVVSCIKAFFELYDVDLFDYIFVFSDHGFRIKQREHLIDNDRIRTLMFVHKRGEEGIRFDHELRSNLDLYPTILEIVNHKANNEIDGLSLFGKGHDSLMIEDHEDFSVRLGQTIEHWAVIDKGGKHWLECSGQWKHESPGEFFDENAWERVISERMSDYEKNHKLYNILHKYDEYKVDSCVFSNGETIKVRFSRKTVPQRLIRIKDGIVHYIKD